MIQQETLSFLADPFPLTSDTFVSVPALGFEAEDGSRYAFDLFGTLTAEYDNPVAADPSEWVDAAVTMRWDLPSGTGREVWYDMPFRFGSAESSYRPVMGDEIVVAQFSNGSINIGCPPPTFFCGTEGPTDAAFHVRGFVTVASECDVALTAKINYMEGTTDDLAVAVGVDSLLRVTRLA